MRKKYKEFKGANLLAVTVQHNGFRGGDSGHGGFVKILFENLASTEMYVNGEPADEFSLEFKGDHERATLLKALKMIVKELEKHPNGF